jgi:hypothetical protein
METGIMHIDFTQGLVYAGQTLRKMRPVFLGLVFGIASVLAGPALAVHPYQKWADELGIDMNVSYDGTRIMEIEGGMIEVAEHRAPGKMYTEVQMQGMSSGVILREDLGKSYLLMPSMGFYKEESLEGGLLQASNGMEFSKIEKMDRETINGFPSTKYQTRFTDNDGKGAGFIWVTDSGVPIKMDMIYSDSKSKGMRISMEFTELNLREQDPAIFELPAGLQPMSFGDIGSIMNMGGGAANPGPATPPPAQTSDEGLAARQQACLQEASERAAQEREKAEKKRKFGRLMGAVARTASRMGVGPEIAGINRNVYEASATARDIEVIADELGITTDEVERCRNPN